MGSDLFLNPPQKVYETYHVDGEDEALGYVVGALANGWEVTVVPTKGLQDKLIEQYIVRVHKGEWL